MSCGCRKNPCACGNPAMSGFCPGGGEGGRAIPRHARYDRCNRCDAVFVKSGRMRLPVHRPGVGDVTSLPTKRGGSRNSMKNPCACGNPKSVPVTHCQCCGDIVAERSAYRRMGRPIICGSCGTLTDVSGKKVNAGNAKPSRNGIMMTVGAVNPGKRGCPSKNWPKAQPSNRDDVRELKAFIDNNEELLRRQTQPIQQNLLKKMAKGTYDSAKAVKLWKYLADSGEQM